MTVYSLILQAKNASASLDLSELYNYFIPMKNFEKLFVYEFQFTEILLKFKFYYLVQGNCSPGWIRPYTEL